MNDDRGLDALGAKQHGAFTRRQASALGFDRYALRRREKTGRIEGRTEEVFVFTSAPDTFELRATVGLLDAGDRCALSVNTGAALYGVAGFELEPIHILRVHSGKRAAKEGVVWHFSRYLPEHHIGVLDSGLRVAVPARVFADMAGFEDVHNRRVERALDSAMAARLLNRKLLSDMAEEWCERGREGSALLRAYLDARPADWVPPASNLQRRFMTIIQEAGFPEPRAEVNLGNAHQWLGRVDCLDPELPLIAEIDSDRFHLAPLDAASDEARDKEMEAAGFTVARFREHEVWYERNVVVERWRVKRNEARRKQRERGSGA